MKGSIQEGRGIAIYDHYRCNRYAPLSPTVRRDYLFKQQVVLKTAINRRRLQFMCPLNASPPLIPLLHL